MRQTKDESKNPPADSERRRNRLLISAIKNWEVLSLVYEGVPRLVEPQTYGISTAGKQVLRSHQIGGSSRSGVTDMGKLFDVAKISALRKTGMYFDEPLPGHNPNDRAISDVFISLPRGGKRTDGRKNVGANALTAPTEQPASKRPLPRPGDARYKLRRVRPRGAAVDARDNSTSNRWTVIR